MIFTFLLVIIAQISVFKMHNMLGIPNLYSLHSWVGVTTVILFFCQVRHLTNPKSNSFHLVILTKFFSGSQDSFPFITLESMVT